MPFACSDVVTRRLVPTEGELTNAFTRNHDPAIKALYLEALARLAQTCQRIETMVGHPILLALWEAPR